MWRLLLSLLFTLLSLLIKQEHHGCLDICFGPEGYGFPLPMYNPEEIAHGDNPYYWGVIPFNILIWYIAVLVATKVTKPLFLKYRNSNKKMKSKAVILTVLFMIIMLLRVDYGVEGRWFITTPSFSRGWPAPYIIWDIRPSPPGITGGVTHEQLAHQYNENNVFMLGWSLFGFITSAFFWFFVSFFLVHTYYKTRKKH
jgi:hypothetical protein